MEDPKEAKYFPILLVQVKYDVEVKAKTKKEKDPNQLVFKGSMPCKLVNVLGTILEVHKKDQRLLIDDSTDTRVVEIPNFTEFQLESGISIDILGELKIVQGRFVIQAHKICVLEKYSEFLSKLYLILETQYYYFKDNLFPTMKEHEEDEEQASEVSFDDKSDDETESFKEEFFNFMLFNCDPDQKLTRANLEENEQYLRKAREILAKYATETTPKELLKDCINEMESKGFIDFIDHILHREVICSSRKTLRDFVYSIIDKYQRHIPFDHLLSEVQSKFPDKNYNASNISKVIDELIGRSLIFETLPNLFTAIRNDQI
ncbi:unnamed protein product [Moneuplotes crassus]|uniref:Uncharacterized protein n=1 Tax=Euplotes crassus TaxID=5936 RepID=A0AAD1XKJ0_EUPCR|nr:unnamed protein product [Moneuplotes crassus]